MDQRGRHRAACPLSGRLRTGAVPTERTLARVCRDTGASVRCNAKLREMNIAVSVSDERSIKVLASGLPQRGHHFEVRSDSPRGGAELCSQQPGVIKLLNIGNFSKVADVTLLWWASRPAAVGVKRRWVSSRCSQEPERAMLHRP